MLHAPTSQIKAEVQQNKSSLAPVTKQERHPHLLHPTGPYSFGGRIYTTSDKSPNEQQRLMLAGLQTTHGNQKILRMLRHSQEKAYLTPLRPIQGSLVQRTCACREMSGSIGDCAECKGEEVAPALLQTKLQVSQPGDPYEQEADRVAEQVMRMPEATALKGLGISEPIQHISIQRSCSACEDEVHRQPLEEEKKEEESLQAKVLPGHGLTTTPALQTRIDALKGSGQPLPETTRVFMERRFGHDFSNVRIHTDEKAAETARAVNARAYTLGQDIVFGIGQFTPETIAGKGLLAHELTHVIQQRNLGGLHHQQSIFPQRSEPQTVAKPAGYKEGSSPGKFNGPPGQLVEPDIIPKLIKASSIEMVPGAGWYWQFGYPLVPGIYDGFMNFTFIASTGKQAIVERNGQYLLIGLDNIGAYARMEPVIKGIWSARWIAVVYPWLIKKTGQVLPAGGPGLAILGVLLEGLGEAGIRDAAKAGIPEAYEFLEEPDLVVVLGTVRRAVLDSSALITLERLHGAQAQKIGARGELYTNEVGVKEFSLQGDWSALQKKFKIKVLPKGATYQHWLNEAMKIGLRPNDASFAATAKAYDATLITSDPHFNSVKQNLGVEVRTFVRVEAGAPRRGRRYSAGEVPGPRLRVRR